MFVRKRYGGELVHFRRDEVGVIEVVDTGDMRSLHFGNRNRQSAVSRLAPDRIELSYVRAMLLSLVFAPNPQRILILGLGGGSLAKFLLQHYPDSRLVVVEYRSGIPPVAHSFFGLPEDTRLALKIADCRDYVCQAVNSSVPPFDHIYIDAFDADGLSPSINQTDFFAACRQLLHPAGCLAINLWGNHRLCLNYSLRLLGTQFPQATLQLPVPDKSNVIGFGLGEDITRETEAEMQRAVELKNCLNLELPLFHSTLMPYQIPLL